MNLFYKGLVCRPGLFASQCYLCKAAHFNIECQYKQLCKHIDHFISRCLIIKVLMSMDVCRGSGGWFLALMYTFWVFLIFNNIKEFYLLWKKYWRPHVNARVSNGYCTYSRTIIVKLSGREIHLNSPKNNFITRER